MFTPTLSAFPGLQKAVLRFALSSMGSKNKGSQSYENVAETTNNTMNFGECMETGMQLNF